MMDPVTLALAKGYTDQRTALQPRIPVVTPEGFTWTDHPLVGRIWTDGRGNFETDFDVSEMQWVGAGKTYYVAPHGDDSNDGLTLATAFRTIHHAITRSDVDIVLVAEGVYDRNTGFRGSEVTRNMSIKALPGHDVRIGTHRNESWEPTEYPSVWKSDVGLHNALAVYDASIPDGDDYTPLESKESVTDVANQPGSWFYDNAERTVYVHTHDERVPDTHIRVYIPTKNLWTFKPITLYVEGIHFEGGAYAVQAHNEEHGDQRLLAKRCTFKYSVSNNNNVVHVTGASLVVMQEVTAARSRRDGFNYHKWETSIPKVIEIACVGRNNGTTSTDNGSSVHDGIKAIRLNGAYYMNRGPNVPDVGDGTESWNLGCVAFGSESAGFLTDAAMWLDGCMAYSNRSYSLQPMGGATIKVRNTRYETTYDAGGTVETY